MALQDHLSQASTFMSCPVRYRQICQQVMKLLCQFYLQCWNKLPHAPSYWALQAVIIEHAPLSYLCCPNMTGVRLFTYTKERYHTTLITHNTSWSVFSGKIGTRNELPWNLKETPYFRKTKYILDTSQKQLLLPSESTHTLCERKKWEKIDWWTQRQAQVKTIFRRWRCA